MLSVNRAGASMLMRKINARPKAATGVSCSVFKVGTHEAMQPGTLALNSLQRKVSLPPMHHATACWRGRPIPAHGTPIDV
jgi:hypothetical protein